MTEPSEASLFEAAVRLRSPAQRAAFLEQACRDHPSLRRRLDALLAAHDETEGILQDTLPAEPDAEGKPHAPGGSQPDATCPACGTQLRSIGGRPACPACAPAGSGRRLTARAAPRGEAPVTPQESDLGSEGIGDHIGHYKLLEKIGEGGFGVVYMAEQSKPVRRRVALKVIKVGMDTRQVIARFEAERQALALMDDPNIAKVFDAGTTGAGRPYFVMELVKGLPITRFCNERRLGQRQRLDLFLDVCSAVQHAHQKGIIHRDLKPSNILVTLHGERAVPKIIDFGIAKAMHQPLTEKTLFTRFDQFVGTPVYMSPEQAALSGLDVDTRSDVYALGVLLYELLSGAPPFDARTLAQAGYDEMRRIIQQEEPPRPSLRLSTMGAEERTSVARDQGTDPDKVGRLLRGDLDWIVMKAIEKDRSRRYETANALAQDLRRHLADEAVSARPPSTAYKLQKAWRRNKVVYSAGALVILALIGGLSLAMLGLQRAIAAKARETELRELATTKAEEAEATASRLEEALYLRRITEAYREVEAKRPADALGLLDACPEPMRNWEWHYLRNRCDGIASPETTLPGSSHSLLISPNGLDLAIATSDLGVAPSPANTLPGRRYHLYERSPVGSFQASSQLDQIPGQGQCGIRFGPDGIQVLTIDSASGFTLWDLATSRQVQTFTGPSEAPRAVAFHPRELEMATSGPDDTIRVWDLSSGEEILTLDAEAERNLPPNELAYSPDGRWLAATVWGGMVKVWERSTGQRACVLGPHSAPVDSIAFSADSRVLASTDNNTVRLWEIPTGRPLPPLEGHKAWLYDVAFSPDGSRVASCGVDRVVKIWDWRAQRETLSLTGHRNAVTTLAFTADDRLVTLDADGALRTWDGSPSRRRDTDLFDTLAGHAARIWTVAFAPDGRLFSCDENDTAMVRDLDSRRPARSFTGIFDVAVSADGRLVLTAHSDLIDTSRQSHVVRILDAYSLEERFTAHATKELFCAAFSPDGDHLAAGGLERNASGTELLVWDWRRSGEPHTVGTHDHYLIDVEFSPDGRHLASASADGVVKLWEAGAGRLLEPQDGRILCGRSAERELLKIAFSPDSRRLATGDGFNDVVVIDVETGEPVFPPLTGHGEMVTCVAFSPDGRFLASAGADATVRLWDARTGRHLKTYLGHKGIINSVAFHPTEPILASGGQDQVIRLWRVNARPDEPRDRGEGGSPAQ